MKVLDLFSGIGGFSLGLERAGMETVAFCEFDEHARKVLKKHWPDVPIHNDVRTLDGKQYRGTVDIVCGGFPCQDLSTAGKQAGFGGERSSLYREMLRIISECLPRYAIFENVTGLLSGDGGRWFARFLYDLAKIGYDAEWHCISASELGAHHHRDRVWVICYPDSGSGMERTEQESKHERAEINSGIRKNVANAPGKRQSGQRESIQPLCTAPPENWKTSIFESMRIRGEWSAEPNVGRVANGVPNRSHRLKQLGNAVVPQIPEAIGRAIINNEKRQGND